MHFRRTLTRRGGEGGAETNLDACIAKYHEDSSLARRVSMGGHKVDREWIALVHNGDDGVRAYSISHSVYGFGTNFATAAISRAIIFCAALSAGQAETSA